MITWLLEHATEVLWFNITLYTLQAILFACAGDPGRALYFLGAAVLTIGVYLT